MSPAIRTPRQDSLQTQLATEHMPRWSRRRPPAVRLEALASPPLPGSKDFPTVPGIPRPLPFLRPTSRAAIAFFKGCYVYSTNRRHG